MPPALTPIAIDVEGAITNALANRTDIARLKKQLDNVDVGVRFAENQRMPGLDVVANYNVIGYAGTQFVFGRGLPAAGRRPERALVLLGARATCSARTSAPGAWR